MGYKVNSKYFLVMLLALVAGVSSAQTGINTRNPQGVFHVDGGKDNALSGVPTATQLQNDFIVTNTGFIGIGLLAPKVKLDLRSSGLQNAFGLGTTTVTAAAAGAGAIRYEATLQKIQISDGVVWATTIIPPVKSVVVARMANAFAVARTTDVDVTNWDEIRDMSNSFIPATGIFTAPRDGVYSFLLTYNFVEGTIEAGSQIETQFINAATNTVLARSYKTFGKEHKETQAGGASTITLRLTTGTTIRPRLRQNITAAGARNLRVSSDYASNDGGFNNLTIIEH